jgi:hypothetical protein
MARDPHRDLLRVSDPAEIARRRAPEIVEQPLLEAVDSNCHLYLGGSDRAKKEALLEIFRQVYADCERRSGAADRGNQLQGQSSF